MKSPHGQMPQQATPPVQLSVKQGRDLAYTAALALAEVDGLREDRDTLADECSRLSRHVEDKAAEVERLRAQVARVQQQAASAALQAASDAIYDEWPGGTGKDGLVVMWAEDWLRDRAAALDETEPARD